MQALMNVNGYVRMKLWGNGIERFFNLCAHKELYLWNLESRNKYVYANISLKDFYKTKKLARKAGVRAVVVERHGLPFLFPKIKKRVTFGWCLLLFFVIVLISSNMLLHIEFNGNYNISDDVFLEFVKNQDIHYGMRIKNIPLEELEKEIRKKFDVITWASAKIDGTVLRIEVKENEKPEVKEEIIKNTYGSSLYANVDGIVHSIYVRSGVPKVKNGDEIHKGDILVDGLVPVLDQQQLISKYQCYDADADIYVKTVVPVSLVLNSNYTMKSYTGRTAEGFYFSVNGKIYRNHFKEKKYPYKEISFFPKNRFMNEDFPVSIGRFETKEYMNIEKAYRKAEAEQILTKEFDENNALLLQKGVQILEKDVTIDIIMGKWTLKGEMTVIMPAFLRKPNEIPEVLNDSEGI